MKNEVAPIVTSAVGAHNSRETHSHPAFGTIASFSTSQGGAGANFFGSKVKHNHYISVEIKTAELDRDLSNDWIHSKKTIVRFCMSEAQWAQMAANHGKGSGTPITFDYRPEEPYGLMECPRIPDADIRHQFANEMKRAVETRVEDAKSQVEALQRMLESGKVSTKNLREIAANLDRAVAGLPNHVKFIGDQFNEQMEKSTIEAQAEVEARLRSLVLESGLEHLTRAPTAVAPTTLEAESTLQLP